MRAALAALSLLLATSAHAADNAPFYRMGDPLFFEASPQPRQYAISYPKGSTSYRMVNPCKVDIRIRKVESMVETVLPNTGTRYLARTSEVVASSKPRFISIMSVGDPGPDGCTVELQYGTGY